MVSRNTDGTGLGNEAHTAVSRRDCLRGAGAATLVAAQPVAAALAEPPRGKAPQGHSRMTPGFVRIDLQK